MTEIVRELEGVEGGDLDCPVHIVKDETGRLFIRAYNEGGFACVDIDFFSLRRWMESAQAAAINTEKS